MSMKKSMMTCVGLAMRIAMIGLYGVPAASIAQAGQGRGPHAGHDHGAAIGAPAQHGEYVENKGQWPTPILYRADFGLLAMFAERDRLVFSKIDEAVLERVHDAQHEAPEFMDNVRVNGHAWYAWFEGANPSAEVTREGRSSDYFNYFIGNDRSKWTSDVRHFEEVSYRQLWPGVDLRLHDEQGGFKYDVLVADAAAANQVRLRYEGLDGMRINEEGELELRTSVGEVHELAPVAWYADGASEKVDCRFTLNGSTVGFVFDKGVSAARPIVIDPTLIASTLSGTGNIGTTQNYGHTATYDNEGNIYTGAICFGQGYPTLPGAFDGTNNGGIDIAVSKLNPTGTTLLFGTYLGGNGGDYPASLVVTPQGELTVYGSSPSADYPVTPTAVGQTFAGGIDIVVSKLTEDGTALVGSTFMGGSANDGRNNFTSNYGDAYRGEIISDAAGRIFIASCSQGPGFPVTTGAFQPNHAGAQDGVAFCLSPDFSTLEWSTYFGTAGGEMCFGIKLSSNGDVYVCGGSSGTDLPTTAGAHQPSNAGGNDGFIVRFNSNATSVVNCTYFGSPGADVAFFLQLDVDDNAYIFGQSASGSGLTIEPPGIYGQPAGQVFVAEFTPDLSQQVFRTRLGAGNMVPVAFLVDVCRNIYISGYSVGAGWEVATDALYTSGGFYLGVYDPDMTAFRYGTYYTGAGHVDGGTSRFDANGVVYQAVCTSGGFPTTPGAYSNVQPSGWDVGVFKIDFEQSGVNVNLAASATTGCAPTTITFDGAGNADSFTWVAADGTVLSTSNSFSQLFTEAGTFEIMLIGTDSTSCNIADTAYVTVTISDPADLNALFTADPVSSCAEYGVQLTNQSTGSNVVLWDLNGTPSNQPNPYVTLTGPGTYSYTITVFDQYCQLQESFSMSVDVPPATMTIDLPSPAYICPGGSTLLNAGPGYDSYQWSTGETAQIITVTEPGLYDIAVSSGFCDAADQIQVIEVGVPEGMADVESCPQADVSLSPTFDPQSIAWSTGSEDESISVTLPGEYTFMAIDQFGCAFLDTVVVTHLATTDGEAVIPNVFSPNNDGRNDVFEVRGLGVQEFSMEVYNRWGQKMYETKSPQLGWKGLVDNESDLPVPDGTYFYIVSYRDLCSEVEEVSKAGHVTLLR